MAAYLPTEATENPYSTTLSSLPVHLPLTRKENYLMCSAPRPAFSCLLRLDLPSLNLLCWRQGVKSLVL